MCSEAGLAEAASGAPGDRAMVDVMHVTIGSLFAGIGGLELGLERALSATTIWQVEIDPTCRRVLARHWPHAQQYGDIHHVDGKQLAPVDVICGGFPCQDISIAGRGKGLDGERSGLVWQMLRVIRDVGPSVVVMENSPALLARGFGRVVSELAACGFDAEWDCIPARAVGAPHVRDRLFCVAAHPERLALRQQSERHQRQGGCIRETEREQGESRDARPTGAAAEPDWHRADGWHPASAVRRVVDGVPAGVDRRRLTALGNAVVPQVASVVGHRVAVLLSHHSDAATTHASDAAT